MSYRGKKSSLDKIETNVGKFPFNAGKSIIRGIQ